MPAPGTLAVSLGRAFAGVDIPTEAVLVSTPFGDVELHKALDQWLLFRHGRDHRRLPHHIPYRAHIAALHAVGVQSLLVTGFVEVIGDAIALHVPALVSDVVMASGLLPDGAPCTLQGEGGGYLRVDEGLISPSLSRQVRSMAELRGHTLQVPSVVVDHTGGPRSRTAAELRRLRDGGVESISMTMVPEVALAAEVGITVAAVVVGYRAPDEHVSASAVDERLDQARAPLEGLAATFLRSAKPVPSGNRFTPLGGST